MIVHLHFKNGFSRLFKKTDMYVFYNFILWCTKIKKSRLPEDFEVCKTSPIKSRMRNDGFGHSMTNDQQSNLFIYDYNRYTRNFRLWLVYLEVHTCI